MSKKKKKQLPIYKTNMSDNIESMENIMDMFQSEMYTVEHLIEMLGTCYYVNYTAKTYKEIWLSLSVDETGTPEILALDSENKKHAILTIDDVYLSCFKDEDEAVAAINSYRS